MGLDTHGRLALSDAHLPLCHAIGCFPGGRWDLKLKLKNDWCELEEGARQEHEGAPSYRGISLTWLCCGLSVPEQAGWGAELALFQT